MFPYWPEKQTKENKEIKNPSISPPNNYCTTNNFILNDTFKDNSELKKIIYKSVNGSLFW